MLRPLRRKREFIKSTDREEMYEVASKEVFIRNRKAIS